MTLETVYCLLPELLLVLVATGIYLGGAFLPGRQYWTWVAVAGLLAAAALLTQQYCALYMLPGGGEVPLLAIDVGGPLATDLLAQFVRFLAIVLGMGLVLMTSRQGPEVQTPELVATLLMATAGVMLVGVAGELVLLFVALELLSIPTYVLLYLGRGDAANQESTVKYFFLSILSSALLLYGFSFLYGLAGSTRLDEVRAALAAAGGGEAANLLMARLALVLVFAGLSFRIAAVPFHFYAPDVYQGTTHLNAALLSVLAKLVGFVALIRVLAVAMPGLEMFGWRVALILAVLTMTVGNLLALWQDNVRRLLAYSSIAHAGYMLIGLAVGFASTGGAASAEQLDGLAATLFYLGVYGFATLGTFAALVYLGRPTRQLDSVDELAGLAQSHPFSAATIALFMFSLAGIPPLAGFWGKFLLFGSALSVDGAGGGALRNWFVALAIIGVLNAAVAAAYYLRIIAVMYFRQPLDKAAGEGGRGAAVAMAACGILVVALGLLPTPLITGAEAASKAAFATPSQQTETATTQPALEHLAADR